MLAYPRPASDAPPARPRAGSRAGEAGAALLEAVIATVVLLLILIPAAQILVTSGKVVTNAKAQAIAANLASSSIEADRAVWQATPGTTPFSASSCAGTTYSGGATNATYGQILTGCPVVPATTGQQFFVFQSSGWCITGASNTLGNGSGTTVYWVEVMVAWGSPVVPGTSTVVSQSKSVVMSSALQTPAGYSPPASTTSCPL